MIGPPSSNQRIIPFGRIRLDFRRNSCPLFAFSSPKTSKPRPCEIFHESPSSSPLILSPDSSKEAPPPFPDAETLLDEGKRAELEEQREKLQRSIVLISSGQAFNVKYQKQTAQRLLRGSPAGRPPVGSREYLGAGGRSGGFCWPWRRPLGRGGR